MDNILFRFAGLPVYAYGFTIAVGLILGMVFALPEARRHRIKTTQLLDLFIGALVAFFLVGGLVGGIQNVGVKILLRPWLILSNVHMIVGIVAAIIFILFYLVRQEIVLGDLLDSIAPSLALVHSLANLGSDIYGNVTNVPWGVTFGELKLHPVQLYASIGYYLIFAVLWRYRRSKRYTGQNFITYLTLNAWLLFILSFFSEGGLSPWVYGVLSVVLTAFSLFLLANAPLSPYRRSHSNILTIVLTLCVHLLMMFFMVTFFLWRIQ